MRATALKLYPYQEEGVKFLTSGFHKLLADDMGLGKTIQVIEAVNRLQLQSWIVVCPAQVKFQWAREIAKWDKFNLPIYVVISGKSRIPASASVIIVNYELLLRDSIYRQLLARGKQTPYGAVVCDEAHYLKNLKAKRTRRLLSNTSFIQYAQYKWMLTGTPVLNRPIEIYPMLRTLSPQSIEPHLSWVEFGRYFCQGRKDIGGWNMSGHGHVEELSERMQDFMLRRKKDDVLDQLPDKVETLIELDVKAPAGLEDTHIATVRRLLALAKLPEAVTYIQNMLEEVDKVVIFAHHRDVIEGIQKGLTDYDPVILYGGMTADDKQGSVDAFINNPNTRVLVANTQAGGTGIDGLQHCCSYVVFIELDWSPGVMDQAVDRLRRIGQKNTVFVHYLAVPDSLDTAMKETLDEKRSVISRLVQSTLMKEVITMSLESVLERIATSLESLAANGAVAPGSGRDNAPSTESTENATSSAPAKGKGKKAVTAPDPEVKAAVKEEPKKATVTLDGIREAAAKFIASTADRADNKKIITDVLMPKYSATKFDEVAEEDYESLMADLKKSVDEYKEDSVDDL